MQTHNLNVTQGVNAGTARIQSEHIADWAALIGRIGLALIFVWSGYGKLADIPNTVGYMNAYHVPMANVLVWPAALLELVGAGMLLAGWKARWAALPSASLIPSGARQNNSSMAGKRSSAGFWKR